jgi:hypothetical protein
MSKVSLKFYAKEVGYSVKIFQAWLQSAIRNETPELLPNFLTKNIWFTA